MNIEELERAWDDAGKEPVVTPLRVMLAGDALLAALKEYANQDEGWCDLEMRYEFLQEEEVRLRAAIWEAVATLKNDLYSKRVGNALSILDEALEPK